MATEGSQCSSWRTQHGRCGPHDPIPSAVPAAQWDLGMPQDGETPSKRLSDLDYRAYLDERQSLLAAELDNARSFDRWVVTLSGGALGLSIAFVKDLVAPGPATAVWMLGVSWLLFGASIGSALTSIHVSQNAHERFREILDRVAAEGGHAFFNRVRKEHEAEKLPKWIDHLNRASIVSFIGGMVLLAIFVIANLP